MWKIKILLAIAGLIALLVSGYFIKGTYEKDQVLSGGKLRDTVVSKFGQKSKGGSKTLYITFDDREYYIGSNFGKYKNPSIGDTVKVYY